MADEDLLQALASLPSETYTPADRYRDFRHVFMGSIEGKRVLSEILSWSRMLQPKIYGSPIDPYLTHVHEGESNIGRRLLVTVFREPQEKQTTQTRQPVIRRSSED